ncbi:MAG: PepSY domain-containing protein, partial [Gemmataceae bacterium]
RIWLASYNPITGSVSGRPADEPNTTELGWRRFLLRLHTAHGYPTETNSRWAWALIVDAMAVTMCFWGLTGLIMWWQIKATRRLGAVVLILSALAAATLGWAMHAAMTGI